MLTGPRRAIPHVVIVQRLVLHYRGPFFELLRGNLAAQGIELMLVYGDLDERDSARQGAIDVEWGFKWHTRTLRLGSRNLYWQPCLEVARRADLVIVEQASGLLVNYVLLGMNGLGMTRLAFWGHGRNFQADEASPTGEAIKRAMSRRVHWWFAYNEMSAKEVTGLGYPPSRVTVVNNAIDTHELVRQAESMLPETVAAARRRLGVRGNNVCVFIGGMYAEKRLPFLVEACRLVKARVPDLEILFIGAGPDEGMARAAAEACDWMHYLGPVFGGEKVPYLTMSKLLLMPGLVGLAILDAFALEIPLVTTAVPYHSPEIGYLVNGENGLLLGAHDDVRAYADAVAGLLGDPMRLEGLRAGCRRARETYTVEEMADRFASGIVRALA